MDFTPISTQEEFDARVRELYGDVADLQGQITTLTGERDTANRTITQLQGQVHGYEVSAIKHRVALQKGIPAEMAERLTGETEKDIRKDADAMAGLLKNARRPDPTFTQERRGEDEKSAALMNMLHELRGE